MSVTIQELLKSTVEKDASDLHITTYIPPRIRIHGSLVSLDYPPLTPTETKTLIYSLLTDKQKKKFEEKYSDQDEPDSTTHPQEKYPSLIGDNNDLMVSGYMAMLPHIGGSHSNLIRRIIHEPGFPLNKDDDDQPWAWKSQLQKFKRNRKRNKHKLPPRPFPTKKTK